MLMLIWNNITRRRTQSLLTVTITMLTVLVFVMVLGVFQTVNQGLALSRERLGADAILIPKYATADGGDLLFTAIPENIYMDADVLEDAKNLDGVAAMTPQFYAQTLALSCCEPGEEARIIGYDAQTDFILTPYLPDEHKEGITAEKMIVGHNFADDDLVGRFNALAKERKKEIGLLRAIGLRKGQVFGLIIGETCTMALMGGILGSVIALACMDPVIEMLREAFKLSPSVWSAQLALLCGAAGVMLAAALGFAAAVAPAAKSASMDPQAAITQGEVN